MERRFADQAPLWPIAHAAGLQNMRDIWSDAKIKRKMDRLSNARALGVEEALDGNDEMPGDISIKGDTQETHYHYAPPPQQPAVQSGNPPTSNGVANAPAANRGLGRWILPVVAGIGLPLLGAGGAMLYQHFCAPTPAAIQALNNLGIKPGVKVTDTP